MMRIHPPRPAGSLLRGEEGVILLLVLWILALISVIVLTWGQEWRTEMKLAANFREDHQCRRLAEAGIFYAVSKMVESKVAELKAGSSLDRQFPPEIWRGDQSPHTVELPAGKIEVRVEDETGKINLNMAQEKIFGNLFTILGYPEDQVAIMVDSLLDWRSSGNIPRPFGAKSGYYLGLDPPYPARGGQLETVEELSWVRGYKDSYRLSRWLTVQQTGDVINFNAAPPEVLQSLEIPQELVQQIIEVRETGPLRHLGEVPDLSGNPKFAQMLATQRLGFQSSPYYTIVATGKLNHSKARHSIKAVIQLDLNSVPTWEFLYWADDYPG